MRKDLFKGVPPEAILLTDRTLGYAVDEHLAPDFCPLLHVGSHSFSLLLDSLTGACERDRTELGFVGVLQISTGFFQTAGATVLDRRL